MRLRRSDFIFPSGRRRRSWRDVRWALRRLRGESLYSPGSVFFTDEEVSASHIVSWCARRATGIRGRYALAQRVEPARWAVIEQALAVLDPLPHAQEGA